MRTTVLSVLVICFVNSALSSEQQSQVHHKLSNAQFKNIFRRERRDVPDYKLVDIKPKAARRAKRELRPVEFEVDGKKVELNLQPAEHQAMSNYIPVWRAKSERGRQYIYQAADSKDKKIDGIFYEDREKMATLLAYYKDQYIYYDGIFGESVESKVIKAAPEVWRRSGTNAYGGNHFVFNVRSFGKTVALQPHEIDSVEQKLDKPLHTFYPKLLVVVDYSLFETLGEDIHETVKYVATFWNAVNLKYSKIETPKIKIIVTGLIISEDPAAMDYIYRARSRTDYNEVHPYELLNMGEKYFRDEFPSTVGFENYDTIMTMTNLRSGDIIGVGVMGTICDDVGNVGYISDDGNFGGVLAATHELGHLLSLTHDEDNGCARRREDEKSISIMSAISIDVKEYFWSTCSQKTLQKFAWSKRSSCLGKYYRSRH